MQYLLLASFSEVIIYIGYILLAILVLMVMITVHEFGHYIAGKIFGFGIEEFAIGFGPKLFSRKKNNGEIFSIRALPIGGFCAFVGEDAESDNPVAFNNKKPWQRIIVLVSGVLMNYIFALLIIIIMFSVFGHTALVSYKMRPTDSIESAYCLQDKDVILEVDGKNVYLLTDLMNGVNDREAGERVPFTIVRDGKTQHVQVELRCHTKFENVEDVERLYNALGIYHEGVNQTGETINGGLFSTGVRLGVFATIGRSFEYSFKIAGTIFTVFKQLITGSLGIKSLGGTVTTITVTAEAMRTGGVWYFLNISSFIGINFAVFNLLPFPALDGSRAVFTTVEWIRKKPINRRIEGLVHGIGFVLILIFAIFVDLQRCF